MAARKIVFKIMKPGNKGFAKYTVKAPAGKAFTPKGIEQAIEMAANHVERLLPNHDYRFVPTNDGYTFVWEKEHETAVNDSTADSSDTAYEVVSV